jgi:hypothetical protein
VTWHGGRFGGVAPLSHSLTVSGKIRHVVEVDLVTVDRAFLLRMPLALLKMANHQRYLPIPGYFVVLGRTGAGSQMVQYRVWVVAHETGTFPRWSAV